MAVDNSLTISEFFEQEKCKLLIDVVIVGLVTHQIRIPHQQIALFDEFHPLLSKWLPT